ncbi:MAG TPA: hypothetical protein EYP55_09905 [Anaerolineae bacterium]|nr:hypothetical protein [Anaerolineae bacterium]
MSHQALQAIIGMAIVDREFRQALLSSSEEAVAGFDLAPEEFQAVTAIKAETFEEFAGELHKWIVSTNGRGKRSPLVSPAKGLRYSFA